MKSTELLAYAQRLQSTMPVGLTYPCSAYDLESWEEIRTLSARLLRALTDDDSGRFY